MFSQEDGFYMLIFLLPAYNEELSIKPLFDKIIHFCEKEQHNFKIILCNDGSTDKTKLEALKYEKKVDLEIIDHAFNRGLGETERDLFERAAAIADDGDICVRFDCDNTHEPEFINKMITKIQEGYDVIIASRFQEGGGGTGLSNFRSFISLCANKFMHLFFFVKNVKEYSCGFRAYRGSILKKAVNIYGNNFIQLKGLGFTSTLETVIKLNLIGAKFQEIPFVLKYNQKLSSSKMVLSITTLGYIILVLMCYWPSSGWYWQKIKK
jgi:dolichol-phosphate mannosyltransferase